MAQHWNDIIVYWKLGVLSHSIVTLLYPWHSRCHGNMRSYELLFTPFTAHDHQWRCLIDNFKNKTIKLKTWLAVPICHIVAHSKSSPSFIPLTAQYVSDTKGCMICHFAKCQIHPFISKGVTSAFVLIMKASLLHCCATDKLVSIPMKSCIELFVAFKKGKECQCIDQTWQVFPMLLTRTETS